MESFWISPTHTGLNFLSTQYPSLNMALAYQSLSSNEYPITSRAGCRKIKNTTQILPRFKWRFRKIWLLLCMNCGRTIIIERKKENRTSLFRLVRVFRGELAAIISCNSNYNAFKQLVEKFQAQLPTVFRFIHA